MIMHSIQRAIIKVLFWLNFDLKLCHFKVLLSNFFTPPEILILRYELFAAILAPRRITLHGGAF